MPKRKAEVQEEVAPAEADADAEADDAAADTSEYSSSSSDDDMSDAPEVSDDAEDSEGDDDGEPDGGEAYKQITVDFQFFDPQEQDFQGLKALLHSYLDVTQYDSSELTDAVIKQSTVGTLVKSGVDDVPVAVMTVLNTQRYKELQALSAVREFLLAKCSSTETKAALKQAWSQQGTGLLINERLINCPPDLAPPLMQGLFDEIAWATEDEPTQELKDSFKFQRYLVLSRVYADNAAPQQAAPPKGRPPKQPKTAGKAAPDPVVVYVRPEDEFLHQQCEWSYTFPVEGKAVGKDELQPLRIVMLVKASKISAARQALEAVVDNAARKAA